MRGLTFTNECQSTLFYLANSDASLKVFAKPLLYGGKRGDSSHNGDGDDRAQREPSELARRWPSRDGRRHSQCHTRHITKEQT